MNGYRKIDIMKNKEINKLINKVKKIKLEIENMRLWRVYHEPEGYPGEMLHAASLECGDLIEHLEQAKL